MAESTQHKLSRIRPPRVQITYDVEIGGAIQKKELPFVVGIMSDLAGQPVESLPRLKDRKFVEIDRDNINDVLASIAPRLAFRADNKLTNDDSELNVELHFKHMDDFHPVNMLKQVTPLRKLFEARQRLSDLLTKLDGNDALDALLQEIVDNTDGLQEIKTEVGPTGDNGAASGETDKGSEAEA
ncbi:MAG TPA: type VI secretion system contractile sheath small subunit, partial [Nitrospira sp.]|nr:type VI secretion system contractile sheath small subunit [Nitrospira sp.]